jgi:hypothetical protein
MAVIRQYLEHEVTFHEGVRCVEMPCCGFTFDADHADEGGDWLVWTCPNCQPPGAVEALQAIIDGLDTPGRYTPESTRFAWLQARSALDRLGGQ